MTDQYELDDELVHMDELENEEKKHEIHVEDFDQPIGVLEPPAALSVKSGSSLKTAIKVMSDNDVGCVMVVKRKKLIGILTERRLLYQIADRRVDFDKVTVDDFMARKPECLKLCDPIKKAVQILRRHEVRHIPIVNKSGEPIGYTSVKSVVDFIVSFFSEEVMNLPPHPMRAGIDPDGA